MRQLELDLFFQKRQLEHSLSREFFFALDRYKERVSEKESGKTKASLKLKFDRWLCKERDWEVQCVSVKKKWVVNLSSRQLWKEEAAVLSRGLNFAVALKTIPVSHIIPVVEDGLRSAIVPQETADRTRVSVIGVLQKARLYCYSASRQKPFNSGHG